jgi:UDP:flavonoid glycosyltransferase YjiC (YdhE family)
MLNLTIISRVRGSPDFEELMNYRHSHGLPGDLPMGGLSVKRSVHTFCFGIPELELPVTLPSNVGLYGPVTLDSAPLSKEGELSKWLDGGKTVMMCMGTHFNYSEDQVRNTLRGFLAGTSSTDQVLWKLNNKAKFQHILDEELANEQAKRRFRIVDWIDADLGEVMRHANVAAYVHHGGANSYYEAAL